MAVDRPFQRCRAPHIIAWLLLLFVLLCLFPSLGASDPTPADPSNQQITNPDQNPADAPPIITDPVQSIPDPAAAAAAAPAPLPADAATPLPESEPAKPLDEAVHQVEGIVEKIADAAHLTDAPQSNDVQVSDANAVPAEVLQQHQQPPEQNNPIQNQNTEPIVVQPQVINTPVPEIPPAPVAPTPVAAVDPPAAPAAAAPAPAPVNEPIQPLPPTPDAANPQFNPILSDRPPLPRQRADVEALLSQRQAQAELRRRHGAIPPLPGQQIDPQRARLSDASLSYEQRMKELDDRLSEQRLLENAQKAGPGHEAHMHNGRVSSHFHNGELHIVREDPHRVIPHGSHSHTVEETEQNSGFIFTTMITVIALSQIGILVWKKYHQKSFDWASLIGLWIIPFVWSLYGGFWRMLLIWIVYSAVTGYVMRAAIRTPVDRATPRLVYSFFFFVYKACYGLAVAGYFMIMADFLGISFLFLPTSWLPLSAQGFIFMFYGLYYGVLSRDLCQICSQRMAVNLGYIAAKGSMPHRELPVNTCAICDRQLFASIRLTDSKLDQEEIVHTLNCQHKFHDFCLRGWTIIGKRDFCPACNEKVPLRSVFKHPWEATTLAWGVVLDMLRYLIVFNPIIFITAQTVLTWIW